MKLRAHKKAYQRQFKKTLALRKFYALASEVAKAIADAIARLVKPQPTQSFEPGLASAIYTMAKSLIILPNRGPTFADDWWT